MYHNSSRGRRYTVDGELLRNLYQHLVMEEDFSTSDVFKKEERKEAIFNGKGENITNLCAVKIIY